jgi:hypothetical protein
MKQIKWVLLIITILMTDNILAYNIDFSGNWLWIHSRDTHYIDKLMLDQTDSVITGKSESECGLVAVTGAAKKDKVSLNLRVEGGQKRTEEDQNDCPAWIQIMASCQNKACSEIQGTWYDSNHLIGDLTWIKTGKD